jgi:FkbM family methyltransferase
MKTFIEVGANSGQDSIKYLSDGDTFLYAFEPVPYLGDNLIKLLDGAGITTYRLIRNAVTDTDGIATFHLSGTELAHNFACSSLHQFTDDIHQQWRGRPDFVHTNALEVQTSRLDTFIEAEGITEVDYLHIDAQGNDFTVLKSLGDKARIVKAGKCEAANKVALYKGVDNSVYSIMEWLEENGFRIKFINNHFGHPITIEDLPNSTEEVDVNFERI